MRTEKRKKGGRIPKLKPKTHQVMLRFDEDEWNKFITMYEKSEVYAKAVFAKALMFGQPFRVLKVDKTLVDYYTKLSDFHAQFRAIGSNYNQVVKELKSHFSEKKAMALLSLNRNFHDTGVPSFIANGSFRQASRLRRASPSPLQEQGFRSNPKRFE